MKQMKNTAPDLRGQQWEWQLDAPMEYNRLGLAPHQDMYALGKTWRYGPRIRRAAVAANVKSFHIELHCGAQERKTENGGTYFA